MDSFDGLNKFTCTDPESIARGGPPWTLLTFYERERGFKYHYKWAIIGPPAKHFFNGVSLAR